MRTLPTQKNIKQVAVLLTSTLTAIGLSSLSQPSHGVIPSTKDLNTDAPLLIAQSERLTGVWNCNDGGVYFIRQIGNQVWWYGQSSDGGTTWSNVFQGTITGNQITGSWADVPKGNIRGSGWMTLSISGSNRLRKVKVGGSNFGGSVWSR